MLQNMHIFSECSLMNISSLNLGCKALDVAWLSWLTCFCNIMWTSGAMLLGCYGGSGSTLQIGGPEGVFQI